MNHPFLHILNDKFLRELILVIISFSSLSFADDADDFGDESFLRV